jgi:hypothetical protein
MQTRERQNQDHQNSSNEVEDVMLKGHPVSQISILHDVIRRVSHVASISKGETCAMQCFLFQIPHVVALGRILSIN